MPLVRRGPAGQTEGEPEVLRPRLALPRCRPEGPDGPGRGFRLAGRPAGEPDRCTSPGLARGGGGDMRVRLIWGCLLWGLGFSPSSTPHGGQLSRFVSHFVAFRVPLTSPVGSEVSLRGQAPRRDDHCPVHRETPCRTLSRSQGDTVSRVSRSRGPDQPRLPEWQICAGLCLVYITSFTGGDATADTGPPKGGVAVSRLRGSRIEKQMARSRSTLHTNKPPTPGRVYPTESRATGPEGAAAA